MRYINFRINLVVVAFLLVSILSYGQDIPDAAIKKNISVIDNPLQKLVQLNPVVYEYDHANYKHFNFQHGRQYGFISEDIQTVFPSLVKQRAVSYMFGKNVYRNARIRVVDQDGLIPVLVASVKEQQLEIEKLKADLQDLKNKLANLKN